MFSSDVIVRNVGGKKLKIVDSDSVEFATDRNSLRDRYNRLRSSTYNLHNRDMSLAYQAARLELFRDYDVMDQDPILASALDVYSEECVTPNEFGNILTISSTDENIKKILENLFNDILNVEYNLHSWTRSLAKYGDFFLRMDISPEYGVYLVKPMSAYEITRVEGSDPQNINYVKFQHDGLGGGQEYENFEMAHFRLMSDSNYLPYGKSMLEPARRIWKQLSLMEDAMLIHRIVRAPEKRIFKVDVGNIPPSEVDGYIEKLMTKTKKVPYIDERTGDYNLRYNLNNMLEDFWLPVRGGDSGTSIDTLSGMEFTGIEDIEYLRNKMMAALKIPKAFLGYDEAVGGKCVRGNTQIKLLDGRTLAIKDIAELYVNGNDPKLETYSYDSVSNSIIPGKIVTCEKTRLNAELIRVHLDNNTYVDTTPDHGFVLRGGERRDAKDLLPGDSLQAVYTRTKKLAQNATEYEQIYQPSTKTWAWTHKMVDEYYSGKIIKNGYIGESFDRNSLVVVHHADFNRFNNSSQNLVRMRFDDHIKLHAKNIKMGMLSQSSIKRAIATKRLPENRKKQSDIQTNRIKNNPSFGLKLLESWMKLSSAERSDAVKRGCTPEKNKATIATNIRCGKQKKMLIAYNKKYATGRYDMVKELNPRWRTRPTLSEIIDHIENHSNKSEINQLVKLSKSIGFHCTIVREVIEANDYTVSEFLNEKIGWTAGRPKTLKNNDKIFNHKVVRLEVLSEREDTYNMEVWDTNENHNYLIDNGIVIKNSTLSMEDVRFARTIGRMQRIIVSELSKIAVVHLFVQGYKDASLVDFELKLSNPSTVFEQEKIAIWQDKVNLAKDMMESNSFSRKWLYTKLWGMSEDEAEELKVEIINDKKQEWRIEQITAEGNDPMTSNQKVGEDGELSDTGGGDSGGGDIGGDLPDMGGDTGGDTGGDAMPDLPELTESEEPELIESTESEEKEPATREEKDERNRNRDQTGDKKNSNYAHRHPFGEDPLGKKHVHGEETRRRPIRTTNPHPLRVNERASRITLSSMSEELKSIKQTLRQRNMVKSQKSVISETTSMLDESNLMDDNNTRE